MQGSLGASCQVGTSGYRLRREMFMLGISSSINFDAWVVDLRGGWIEEFGHSTKEGSGKMSGKSLMNGFLETYTLNDV